MNIALIAVCVTLSSMIDIALTVNCPTIKDCKDCKGGVKEAESTGNQLAGLLEKKCADGTATNDKIKSLKANCIDPWLNCPDTPKDLVSAAVKCCTTTSGANMLEQKNLCGKDAQKKAGDCVVKAGTKHIAFLLKNTGYFVKILEGVTSCVKSQA